MTHAILFILQIIEFIAFCLFYALIALLFIVLADKIICRLKNKKIHRYIYWTVPVVFVSLIITTSYLNMCSLEKTVYNIHTDKCISDYKIALIADVHYNKNSGDEKIQNLVKRVTEQNADMVVLAGDIVDENSSKSDMEYIFSELGKIKSRYGTFYVNGNHDKQCLLNEENRCYTADELIDAIEKNCIAVLSDEQYKINDEFYLIGRDDISNNKNRKSVQELVKGIPDSAYILSLDHRPCEYESYKGTAVDMLLSGHTHKGQAYPLNYFIKLMAEDHFFYGEKKYFNSMTTIITSGTGGWLVPMKNTSPAEYVIINIES